MKHVFCLFLVCLSYCQKSQALNVVITNDDGFEASTIHALYRVLKAHGHSVVIVSEVLDNSGKGGAADFFKPIGPLTQDSRAGSVHVGAPGVGVLVTDSDVHYVDGTPVAATLYAIDVVAAAKWGRAPDLVISGPNYGNNTGLVNNSSGTVNAALISINRGVPAIAVSTGNPVTYKAFTLLSDADPEFEVAAIVLKIVSALDSARKPSDPILPAGVALNVNIPRFAKGEAAKLPIELGEEGIATAYVPKFSSDLSTDVGAHVLGLTALPALPGVSIVVPGKQGSYDPLTESHGHHSEQHIIDSGAVSISVLKGNHEAGVAENALMVHLLGKLK